MLSPKLSGGPKGLGDPDDLSLRKVEREVLIPKLMREKTRWINCVDVANEFDQCAKENGFFMIFNCRKVNNRMQDCMKSWYENEEFRAECTKEYLEMRSEYRRTGIGQKSPYVNPNKKDDSK
ncbi:COX assembly mitochondrial protein-like protein [Leptotrombidium deliense]|uniref:COX assembly mitochondrial protein n=1 Tax=Leptotrombidium deliense TaxID=299467 RepID=A0A443S6Z3_9ACAR|nr:COX assembly mitochondrial protein-like protein [Leptotrombidium deliense]